jgi:signal peptide peptidase SppA
MNFIHESIFVSSLRAFSKTIFTIFGIALGLIAITMASSVLSSPYIETFRPQMVICPDENGNSALLPSAPVILKISIEGIIGTKKLNTDTITQALQKSKQLLKQDRIKGILLYINSPGGTSIDSAGIYQTIMSYKTEHNLPVYTYVDGLCASGGMYIASSSDYIGATPESVIGSVGVRMGPVFNFKDLMTRYGVDALTITQGKDKDSFNPFRTWTANEGDDIKQLIKDSYDLFVNVVTSARPKLTKDLLVNTLGAQIFSAKTAMGYGYIDQADASYKKVLSTLRETAGIQEKTSYQVLEIIPYKSPFEDFVDSKLKFFSKSIRDQFTEIETKNPICDRVFYLMD